MACLWGKGHGKREIEKKAVNDCMYGDMMALAKLYYLTFEILRVQAKVWGVNPYYLERKIKHSQLQELADDNFITMPKDLEETAKMSKAVFTHAIKPINKIRSIFKDKEELDQIIAPVTDKYEEQNHSQEEAGGLNEELFERRRQQANEANTHPAQGNIAEPTNILKLRPQDYQPFLDYHKSAEVLHDNFRSQKGIQMSNMVPVQEFMKTV